ncbi:carboxypeptidase-like regulatory domain-containing protein [Maribacter litopenaei]|uniref:Carboxypeptidase-like regulatory domain-containing protein n=1 Tax=Maribacter litopenaei TaxID=2976127 RepID=A0ABY5YAQ5_9FLAO|nr:carboxypeptidase-like regulatory domain-containing protein [Maribacter litopenaei]UWX56140.1 carboxypeptidase-like regulatory domain-containing protein [Maribacter litopenaei]
MKLIGTHRMNSFLWKSMFFLFPGMVLAQTVLKGTVKDADTGLPLPFVNIGFVDRGLGTVSEENGTFNFSFDASNLTVEDTLKISYLAFKEYKIPFSVVQTEQSYPLDVLLEPDILSLNEVVLTSKKRKRRNKSEKMVGYSYVGQLKNGSWEGDGALGGELITKINVSKKQRQLNAFYFYVLENKSDSLLVRVNIYEGGTKVPEERLTNKNIIYTIKTRVGKVGIDLTPYDIIVEDDFSIGIELLKVYGDQLGLVVAGDDTPGVSYRRYASQGEWLRYPKDALTYFVSTTLVEETEEEDDLEGILVKEYSKDQLLQSLELKPKQLTQVGGFVFYEGKPLANAQVLNLTSGEVASTNDIGRYNISVNVNDELEFSFGSLQTQIRKVFETSYSINVSLEEKIIALDETVVTGQKKIIEPKRNFLSNTMKTLGL